MQITPKEATPSPAAQGQASARDRAIATLTAQAPQLQNASAVSPEEMGAIPQTKQAMEEQEAGNTTLNEAPKAVEEPAEKKDQLSVQYAKLAKQEKALRAQAQQLRQREAAIKAKEAATVAPTPVDESKYVPRDRLKTDLLALLAEEGVSFDELTNSLLTQSSTPQDPQMMASIRKLEQQLKNQQDAIEEAKKLQVESQKQQYNQAVAQIREDVKSLVRSDSSFETVRETNSVDDVVELIERTFNEEKRLMSVDEAAQAVEDYLVEEAIKLTKIGKIRSKLAPPVENPAPQQSGAQQKQPQAKTLTNTMSNAKPMTARQRAIAVMEGKIK